MVPKKKVPGQFEFPTYWTGTSGNDEYDGGEGNDVMTGGAGDDRMFGHGGNDTFIGGPGSDSHLGGAGIDKVSYVNSPSGIRIKWHQGEGGDAEGDFLSGIENVSGSSHDDFIEGDEADNTFWGNAGHDQLLGGEGNDRLEGGEGDDSLNGGEGDDVLIGGAGSDTAFYDSTLSAVFVDLINQTASGDRSGRDTLSGIENVRGTSRADVIFGNSGDNVLRGLTGDDIISAGAGNDTLQGDDNATLIGGTGSDVFITDFVGNAGDSHATVLDFEMGIDKVGLEYLTRAEAFGLDGQLRVVSSMPSSAPAPLWGDRIAYNQETGDLYRWSANGGWSVAGDLRDGPSAPEVHLTAADFWFL